MGLPEVKNWQPILEDAIATEKSKQLKKILTEEYREQEVYPPMEQIWQAFEWTDYEEVKVVILGQDPYHGKNQAHGLSFSVQPDVKIPPSLRNIYKELETDLGLKPPLHGYLESWAKQGVFLLNTVLTVRKGAPHSHKGLGWEEITDEVIKKLNEREKPLIFFLWGNASKQKRALIDEKKHVVFTSTHPSPFSAHKGFLGSRPFSKANEQLKNWNQTPIDWSLPEIPHDD